MTNKAQENSSERPSRRDFIKASSALVAGGAVVGPLSISRTANAAGSDVIRIGLIGCGGRGTGAATQAIQGSNGTARIVAMGDVFDDKMQKAYRSLKGLAAEFDVPKERQFVGLDCYQKVLACDLDMVILATPPGFRPLHYEAAIKAGKHVFMEKPVAVDAAGVRKVLAATEESKKKGLAVAVGLQRRHEAKYIATIKAIHDGAIGDIVAARAYWNGATPWVNKREPGWTEVEYQMRNWYYFNWICGDHIVEQHIHNLDVINWVMNGYPVEAQGQGGCQVRKGKDYGETFDHHFVEFTYGKGTFPGVTMLSQCRHIPNCWNTINEYVHGTKGYADVSGSKIYDHSGAMVHNFAKLGADGNGGSNGHAYEHVDLFRDLKAGKTPNEGEYGALSTMTAIMGRMCTYSGEKLSWDDALNSKVIVSPVEKLTSFNDQPFVTPDADGMYPQPVPGVTKVV
jgi:myo-inositol 2-dehydrogenase/D-chiro-inositol 1-dehydrogenase